MVRQILILLLSVSTVIAEDLPDYSALEGVYDIVGRKPDSQETYSGTIRLTSASSGLCVERRVGEAKILGTRYW